MKSILLLWVFFFCSFSVTAQTWKELNDSLIQYYNNGEYKKGRIVGEKAVIAAKNQFGEDNPYYATSMNNLALLYESMGEYAKAEPLNIEAMGIRKKALGESHPDYAQSLNNLALLYQDMGQYEKAEPLYIEAKEITKKVLGETHPNYATSLNNLAELYKDMGQYEKAEPLFIKAIEIWKKVLGETHPNYSTSLNNLAGLYKDMGQYEKAEPFYIEAKEIRKKVLGETHPLYAASLNNLALLYDVMGQFEKAEPLYIQATAIAKKALGENHPDYATSLNNLASIYEGLGQYEKAEPLLLLSKEIRKKVLGETHPDYAGSLKSLADLYERMGQYEKAESFILLNNQIKLKNLKKTFTILSEKEKGNYLNNNISIIESNNSFLYNYRKASSSILKNNFNLQLFFKSLSLAETRNMLEQVGNSMDSTIKKLFLKWRDSKTLLSKQYSLPVSNRMPDLAGVETQTESLEKELGRRSSEFRNQQNTIRISLQDVQKNLQQDEVAIEFVSFHLYNKKWTDSTMYAAYILHKNDSVPVFVPLCEEKQLQKLFASAGKTTTALVSSFYRGAGADEDNISVSKGDSLYKLIWQPLEPYLKGINKISYSPAGKLYTIAFNALPAGNGKILMDKYQLQQYTSTRQIALRNNVNETTTPKSIALFGDATFTLDSLQLVKNLHDQPNNLMVSTNIYAPQSRGGVSSAWSNLPGTAEEVKKIQQLFIQNKITTKTFIQQQASEENLKTLSGNSPQILHIATHGFFLPEPDKKRKEINDANTYSLADDPLMRSGILLAGANYAWSGKTPINGVEDGIATAYEISQLDLSKTELVVLSACETALGDIKGSEGVFGLQRSFKMAGVNKLIVSLWQVPDKETSELMTMFYSNWFSGKNIEQAFYTAQAEMRKKYSAFYWAAFVLVE